MPFLNHDHKPIIKHPYGHPVDVIAAFNPIGDIIPRYIRIEDDTCEKFNFKIDKVNAIKDHYMVKTFYCSYFAYGYQNDIVLIFDIIQCLWVIG